jgi:hypothetical protein
MDLTGVDAPDRAPLQQLAASNIKRVSFGTEDWTAKPDIQRLMSFLEIKTVWHPAGT